ncbi:MAG: transposase [Myxococcales bacterium]|nr:transposase [Myxococcales bacterium]
MTLPAQEFLRRFLQHVLPGDAPRVRAFRAAAPLTAGASFSCSSLSLSAPRRVSAPPTSLPRPRLRCPACSAACACYAP